MMLPNIRRTGSNPTYKVTYGKVSFVVRMKPPGEKNQGLFGVSEHLVVCLCTVSSNLAGPDSLVCDSS